jgi:hypothetical protein
MARPAPQAAADQETAEDAAPVVKSTHWETVYLCISALLLLSATLILLVAAGQKYNIGIFAKGGG